MNKKEFLSELRKNLSGLPKEEIEDKLNFYEEMINDRIDEGKTEEEAVHDIGTTDDALYEIASKTKLTTLVKGKIKPKRKLKGFEIAIIILGFPCWFPLLVSALVLLLVAYLLTWVLVLVAYSIEIAFVGAFFMYLISGFCCLATKEPCLLHFGLSIFAFGCACLFLLACIPITKLNIKFSKKIFTNIKSRMIRGGGKEDE